MKKCLIMLLVLIVTLVLSMITDSEKMTIPEGTIVSADMVTGQMLEQE